MKKIYTLVAVAASMSFAAKIGVLVNQGSCPSGHYPTIITLDAEDSNNATEYSGDDKKPIGITGKSLVEFSYCVFDYDELYQVSYDYVVLRMDDACPKGSMAFARYHDTEDSNNDNSPKGSFLVSPSDIGDNAKLEYCFVPKATKTPKYQYPFQNKYGVFANPSSSSSIVRNRVKVDDEDSKNKNGWDWHNINDNSIRNRIKSIVEDGKNVVYHTIKWKGNESATAPMSTLWRATVGVIRVDNKASCQRKFTIDLDAEDSSNKTGVTNGSSSHPGIHLGSHVKFDYCVIDGTDIPRARYDYVVLRTSKYCPSGTYPVARYHDTEDSGNGNSPKGSSAVWPSDIGDNANLEYCFVPKKSGGKAYPFSSSSYGVFANNPGINNIVYTEFRVDDEDNDNCIEEECRDEPRTHLEYDENGNPHEVTRIEKVCECVEYDNNNDWNWYGKSNMPSLIGKIIFDEGHDTYYRYIHWNGKSLSKSAEVVEAPAVGEIAPSAAVSLSPEIKGFDHSAVTVEIKSAGKIVVSIMNIRGDVVATVSQDNLLPGIHMVKWNSGVVPNGRYVVAVKQNGKISAKNVILK